MVAVAVLIQQRTAMRRQRQQHRLLLHLVTSLTRTVAITHVLHVITCAHAFAYPNRYLPVPSLRRKDVAGVWRITFGNATSTTSSNGSNSELEDEQEPQQQRRHAEQEVEKEDLTREEEEEEVLLKLNQDGTYSQYGADEFASNPIERREGQMQKWLEREEYRRSDQHGDSEGIGIGKAPTDENDIRDASTTPNSAAPSSRTRPRLRGSWDIVEQNMLLLASDRRLDHDDTLLSGRVVNDTDAYTLSVPEGQISAGRFMYPRSHPSFFEQPMYDPNPEGTFELRRILAFRDALSDEYGGNDNNKVVRYRKRDFYGKKFLLTVSPIPTKQRRGRGTLGDDIDFSSLPFDVRVMPIEFFANNTFTAIGTNKILRGRYGTTGEEKEQLWFSVSLFGSGRSVKGSVYSEGLGLGQDDKRTYHGEISEERTLCTEINDDELLQTDASVCDTGTARSKGRLSVQGSVLYGTDFDEGARPHPVAVFVMREVKGDADGESDDGT